MPAHRLWTLLYKAKDEEHKKKVDAKNSLENYAYSMCNTRCHLLVLLVLGLVHLYLLHHLLDLLFAQLALVVGDGDPILLAGGIFP
jgi:fatty-acid desaturase